MRACWLLLCVLGGIAHAELEVSSDGAVIDGKHFACGQEVTVVGTYADESYEDSHPRYFPSPMLLKAVSIDQTATQHAVDCFLFTSDPKWIETHHQTLKAGAFYQVKGMLRDGMQDGAGAHFYLEVESAAECQPLQPGPRDFAGRHGVYQGEAAEFQSRPAIHLKNDWLRMDGLPKWPEGVLGKQVSAAGIVAVDAGGPILTRPKWELCDLRDLLGQNVSLEGYYWAYNAHWRFRYRDANLYVDGPAPQAGWEGRTIVVSGKLERQIRRSLEVGKSSDDLAECFVVREAQGKFLEAPKNQPATRLSHLAQKFTDGVPDLIFRTQVTNLLGNETVVSLLSYGNAEVLRVLLRPPNDAAKRVLLRKMNDAASPAPLRLLYAGVLAELGESAGREAVLKAAQDREALTADALWLMTRGLEPYRDIATPAPDWNWADDFLIEAINDETKLGSEVHGFDAKVGPFTMRQAVLHFGNPEIELANSGRVKAIKALLGLVAENIQTSRIYFALGAAHPALPPEFLLQLVKSVPDKERTNLCGVLEALLKQGNSDAAWWFAPNLGDDKIFTAFLDCADSDATALIEVRLSELKGLARIHAQELLTDRAKDPAGEWLRWIEDPHCPDRFTALCRLKLHPDPRIPAALAKMLRTCLPRDLGEEEFARQQAAEQALEAMAHCGEPAIDELIGLLDADLGRFGSSMDSAAFHRVIAGLLSEITHEGFGADQAAWRRWREQQRKQ